MDKEATSVFERGLSYLRKEGVLPTLLLAGFYLPSVIYHTRLGLRDFNTNGYDLFAEDWDNLIILDACRFDIFDEYADLPGETKRQISRASSTSEFIRANFTGRYLTDTVYIAGNSWYLRLRDEIDSELYRIYEIGDNSDGKKIKRTVECAKHCKDAHQEKRLIIHFIPPHHPYEGPIADEHFPPRKEQLERPMFERIRRGDISIDDAIIRDAYRENLNRVLPAVEELLQTLTGKTIVTADHGEMLGERSCPIPIRYYGHIPKLYTEELITVPWHTYTNGERRQITHGQSQRKPISTFTAGDRTVDQRLRDLGYKV